MFSIPTLQKHLLLAGLVCATSLRLVSAYVEEGPHWPDKSSATMQLQLGSTNVVLEDGFATWDASAADALSLWNQSMDAFEFAWASEASTTQASGDGTNSVFLSNSVFGDTFGDGVLAVTVLLYDAGPEGEITKEADVVVNQAFQFNSYRGALKPGDPLTRVYDIHRIFLHEFGHVLGLDHPDAFGQDVAAIMNSIISNLDHLATDDIEGATALYGLRITSPGELDVQVSKAAKFQVTTNANVTSYTATGLPDGLTINNTTGLITGTVKVTGGFTAQVTVHAKKDVAASLFVYVTSTSGVGDLRQLWGFTVNRLITDPLRNRVYASLPASKSVAIIDSVTLTLVKTIAVTSEPSGMAISSDGNTLFVAERGTSKPVIGVIDLQTLEAEPSVPAPFPSFDVVAVSDNRLVVTAWGDFLSDIALIDDTTGSVLGAFTGRNPRSAFLQVSPDRKTIYAGDSDVTPPAIYAFDVSSNTPTFLQQTPFDRISGVMQDLKLSHDGTIISAADGAELGDSATLLRIPTDDLSSTEGGFVLPHDGATRGAIAFSPDDKTMLVADQSELAQGVDVFDAATQVYQRTILTDYLTPSTMTTDRLDQYLFVGSWSQPELRVYALGTAGLPAHQPQAKSLLNVSTRLNTEAGEKTLIAGFIITGDTPKNVVIRGLGPSLPLQNALQVPTISLFDSKGTLIAGNTFWNNAGTTPVVLSGLAPQSESDAALYVTLFPGSYTVTLFETGYPGIGLLEVYDISADTGPTIANLSTRGNVGTGDDVMIGGIILSADQPTRLFIRAIGPSLAQAGIADPLADPMLELHGANGDLISSNDDWRTTQEADIIATSIPPTDNHESAILATLTPRGLYRNRSREKQYYRHRLG